MKIALLNRRVLIQKSRVVVDEIGNRMTVWEPYYSCHATVSGEGRGEQQAAGQTAEHPSTDFTLRWCRKADAVTPEGFRVLFAGDVYNILGIDHMNYRHLSVKLMTEREKGGEEYGDS